ncbi:MAG TPA: hypothetical protein VGC52_11765 [Gemmatimonadaceae bacterium]
MTSTRRTLLLVVAGFLAFAMAACDEPTAPPQPGTIQVSVTTSGGDLDDGYEIIVADQHRFLGSNAGTSFSVISGRVRVELSQIAENCTVAGENPRTVELKARQTVPVAFVVSCAATGIQVTLRTTGIDIPELVTITVDNRPPSSIAANGSFVVGRLTPGSHTVAIAEPEGANCNIAGQNPRTVIVSSRVVVPVAIDITCSAVLRREKIAYSVDSAAVPQLALANPDGSGQIRLAPGHSPTWAPDGKLLAFSTTVCDDFYFYYHYCVGGLYLLDPELRRLTFVSTPGTYPESPAWAPTGDVIAYVNGDQGTVFFTPPAGTTRVQLLVPGASVTRDPSWSPDGQRLALSCGNGGPTDYSICTVKRDGTDLKLLTSEPGVEAEPAWSPDGTRIAFSLRTAPNAQKEIALVPAQGGQVVRITEGFDPAWSRDGSKIVFSRVDGLYTINPDGTELKRLTTGAHREPAWRP